MECQATLWAFHIGFVELIPRDAFQADLVGFGEAK